MFIHIDIYVYIYLDLDIYLVTQENIIIFRKYIVLKIMTYKVEG